MLAGNHKPSLRGVDEAIRRRVHLIPFTVTIPREERDHKLAEKLRDEWPGILWQAVQGCLEWQRFGLRPPPAVTEATEEYLRDQDVLGQWVEERCIVSPSYDPTYETKSSTLFADWKSWAAANGLNPGSNKSLTQALIERGFQRKHTNKGALFIGIKLDSSRDPLGE